MWFIATYFAWCYRELISFSTAAHLQHWAQRKLTILISLRMGLQVAVSTTAFVLVALSKLPDINSFRGLRSQTSQEHPSTQQGFAPTPSEIVMSPRPSPSPPHPSSAPPPPPQPSTPCFPLPQFTLVKMFAQSWAGHWMLHLHFAVQGRVCLMLASARFVFMRGLRFCTFRLRKD